MSIYDDDDEGFGTPYPAARAKRRQASPLPRKNMTTREILEYCLNGYDEDMELRINTISPNDAYLDFDGEKLRWIQNNKIKSIMDAQSGQDAYQCSFYQDIPDKGPLPEGKYYVKQSNRQNFSDQNLKQMIAGIVKQGTWPGSLPAWGLRRVWLEPNQNTETYGRSGFSIHGGFSKGSAGCIDIPWQTSKLKNLLDQYGKDIELKVHYPKKCW